jgi:hypothetical protein
MAQLASEFLEFGAGYDVWKDLHPDRYKELMYD